MKKVLSLAILGCMAFGTAHADLVMTPHFLVSVVQCRDTSGLPNGLSLTITQAAEGAMMAELTNRDDIGPFVELGKIPVTLQDVPSGDMGAGMTYVGNDFQLHINNDSPESSGSYYSNVYVNIQNRVFNEPMYCDLPTVVK